MIRNGKIKAVGKDVGGLDAGIESVGWYNHNSDGKTHPVGRKRPNAWGLYDMHGNVWEWCQDWDGDDPERPVTDPTGADSGSYRVKRGGNWYCVAVSCRSANRNNSHLDNRNNNLGFRIAVDMRSVFAENGAHEVHQAKS